MAKCNLWQITPVTTGEDISLMVKITGLNDPEKVQKLFFIS
jgi:hypothetical protein